MMHLHVITDLQYGSCGKGLFAGYLAEKLQPDALFTAWAPNAGHTYVDADGEKMINLMLPNGIIAPSVTRIFIGPGSIIQPATLHAEIDKYAHLLGGKDINIHPYAAVVADRHRHEELAYGFQIGSTMKGAGAALIEKIRRDVTQINPAYITLRDTPLHKYITSVDEYNEEVDKVGVGILEGAQGFSLSINQGFYPYTTSRDCTTTQLMSDCGIPADVRRTVYGVCRTFPIRVANRYDDKGRMIGSSGPGYPDQQETSWAALGLAPERTTVTQLERRVFTFSHKQIRDAIRMNGVNYVFINFVNYLEGQSNGAEILEQIQATINTTRAMVHWLGYGPRVTDIRDTWDKS